MSSESDVEPAHAINGPQWVSMSWESSSGVSCTVHFVWFVFVWTFMVVDNAAKLLSQEKSECCLISEAHKKSPPENKRARINIV